MTNQNSLKRPLIVTDAKNKYTFSHSALKGSKLRCLLMTHQSRKEVARILSGLAPQYVDVSEQDLWMPGGFFAKREARLDQSELELTLPNSDQRQTLHKWWLGENGKGNTPNWDIAATCKVKMVGRSQPGLLLIEAKAHETESGGKSDCCKSQNDDNADAIARAISEASRELNRAHPGTWNLSATSHYQLANRFALGWKLAKLGIPVVLAFVAYLNAEEMDDGYRHLFRCHDDWTDWLRQYCAGRVPDNVWNSVLDIDGTPLVPRIASVNLRWDLRPA